MIIYAPLYRPWTTSDIHSFIHTWNKNHIARDAATCAYLFKRAVSWCNEEYNNGNAEPQALHIEGYSFDENDSDYDGWSVIPFSMERVPAGNGGASRE